MSLGCMCKKFLEQRKTKNKGVKTNKVKGEIMKKIYLSVCTISFLASNTISQNVELDSSIVSTSG